MSQNLLPQALLALDRGFAVLPVWWAVGGHCGCPKGSRCEEKQGKHPIGKLAEHGVHSATKDAAVAKKWWDVFPLAGVGIACGEVSGIVVLDVDPRHHGDTALEKLIKQHGPLVETYKVKTGGDGLHYYFEWSEKMVTDLRLMVGKKKKGEETGLDVQADGQYVVGPGSSHVSGGSYELLSVPNAAFEKNIFQKGLVDLKKKRKKKAPPPQVQISDDAKKERAQEVLENRCRVVATAGKGERYDALNHAGLEVGHHIAAGSVDYQTAYKLLFAAAEKQAEPKTADEIRKTLEKALQDGMRSPAFYEVIRYTRHRGKICWLQPVADEEPVPVPLCNFNMSIVEEVLQDDGSGEVARFYVVEGKTAAGAPLAKAKIAAKDFDAMNWISDVWGRVAVAEPEPRTKMKLHVAVKTLSPDAPVRRVFTHTGWTTVQGAPVYLSGNGAIGEHGPVDGVEVNLGRNLAGYKLARRKADVREAMRTSLKLLDPKLAAPGLMVPLWSYMYRAPLCSTLALDTGLHVFGSTGRLKTTLVALALAHHGTFNLLDGEPLPGAWSATANALEAQAFLVKDSVLVIDDYSPTEGKKKEFEAAFDRIFRGLANQQGRTRLSRNSTLKEGYVARGGIISTGETFPTSQSLLARILLLEASGRVDLSLLTEAQRTQWQLPVAMAAYVAWLAPQLQELKKKVPAFLEESRNSMRNADVHKRILANVSQVVIGAEWGLRFAVSVGALSESAAAEQMSRIWGVMIEVANRQSTTVASETPVKRFLEILESLFAESRIVLLEKSVTEFPPQGGVYMVGWQDDSFVYLLPRGSYGAVVHASRDSGEPFSTDSKMLWRAMQEGGLLGVVGPNRVAAHVRLGGNPGGPKHVIVLDRQAIHKQFGIIFPGHKVQHLKFTVTEPAAPDTVPVGEEADSRAF